VFRTLGGLGLWFPVFHPDSTVVWWPQLCYSLVSSPPCNSSVRGSPLDIFVSLLFTCVITSNGLFITIVRLIYGVQPGTLNFAQQASIHCNTIQPAALLNPGFFASDFFELCNYPDMHTCRKPWTHVLPTQWVHKRLLVVQRWCSWVLGWILEFEILVNTFFQW